MNTIDTSKLLTQLRAAAAQAENRQPAAPAQKTAESFASVLGQQINNVNAMQQDAGNLTKAFEMGTPGVTLPQVMVAKGKAGLAFEGMVQVRNKVVEAYQEIMRMQV